MGWKKDARAALAADPDLGAVEWVVVFYNDTHMVTHEVTGLTFMQAQQALYAISRGDGTRFGGDTKDSPNRFGFGPAYWERAEAMTRDEWDGAK